MIAVGMVQVAINQVIDVIAVRNGRVAAIRAVLVGLFVALAAVLRRAFRRVCGTYGQHVFLNLVALGMVHAAIVQVIDVAFVNDAGVPAIRPMLVGVPLVLLRHD
jgi:hypothetical protein